MASTSETGHAKNVANFQDLISFVTSYGATYNPSKNGLKLPQLTALYTTSQTKLAEVVAKNTSFNNAVNDRMAAFDGLKALSTRLVNALDSTDATAEKIEDAKVFNRKLQGKKASSSDAPTDPNTPAPETISASQQSYDQQIQHFAGLISVLQSEPSYSPNELELKIATLTTKQADLTAKNNAVSIAYSAISNTRIARNKTLYDPNTGLVDTALEVKKYIKSIYGASSPEFTQVNKIQFKNLKK